MTLTQIDRDALERAFEIARQDPAQRRRIDERISMLRELEDWFRSRRGYK